MYTVRNALGAFGSSKDGLLGNLSFDHFSNVRCFSVHARDRLRRLGLRDSTDFNGVVYTASFDVGAGKLAGFLTGKVRGFGVFCGVDPADRADVLEWEFCVP